MTDKGSSPLPEIHNSQWLKYLKLHLFRHMVLTNWHDRFEIFFPVRCIHYVIHLRYLAFYHVGPIQLTNNLFGLEIVKTKTVSPIFNSLSIVVLSHHNFLLSLITDILLIANSWQCFIIFTKSKTHSLTKFSYSPSLTPFSKRSLSGS